MFVKNVKPKSGCNTQASAMSVDCPLQQASLKRSSSAPMINEITSTMSISSPSTSAPPMEAVTSFSIFSSAQRTRRFSTSSPGSSVGFAAGPRFTPRVNQLRQEECIDAVAGREVAHEKEIHSAMQISQSWEDLTFDTEGLSFKDSSAESSPSSMLTSTSNIAVQSKSDAKVISKKVFDPISISLSPGGPPSCSSPSPTRSGLSQRQCYSPSLHAVAWKNGSLSPSPTRKAFATRRSLSPIRPSCLGGSGIKRKFELEESSTLQPPIKRAFNLIMSNPSRAETSVSPFLSLTANSTGSVGTPESISSVDSPNFSNQLAEESSPSSGRALLQCDDTSMSDSSSNGPQQVKPMDSELNCDADNR